MMPGPTSGEAHSTGNAAGPKRINQTPYQHNARPALCARFEQRQTVLSALQQRPHTALDLRKMGVRNPPRYVADLILMGHEITSTPTCVVTPTGSIISTTVYTLVEGSNHE